VLGRFLVPADERRVVAWFFRDLFVPHGRRERLLRRAVRLAEPLPVPLDVAFRDRRPIAEVAADEAGAEVLAAVEWLIAGAGRPLFAEGLAAVEWPRRDAERALPADRGVPERPSWLAAADYAGTGRRRSLVFLFAPRADRPVAMAKVRPDGAAGEPLATEREAIDRVRAELPADLAATVPRVLASRRAAGREGLLLAALPGRSAWAELHGVAFPARAASRHLAAAADWLARFHAATRRDEAYRLPPWSELAPGEPDPPPWYRRLEERLAHRPLPLAAGHGDFWPRNVLVAGGAVTAVVDWEAARPAAPPFDDLFAFAWSVGIDGPWRRGRPLPAPDAFRRAFLDDGTPGRAVAAYFARSAAALGLDGDTLRDLFRLWLRTRPAGHPEGGDTWRTYDRMLGETARSAFSG
jgi:aminoglycoside phosphotransferase